MIPRILRQFCVKYARAHAELFHKEAEAVPAVDVVDKDEGLAGDEAHLEEKVEEEVLFLVFAAEEGGEWGGEGKERKRGKRKSRENEKKKWEK